MLPTALGIVPHEAAAQTPAQMEYDRQQREYRQQQEQQRQEQQRQQQLMNENARRQQEESRQLNALTGQSAPTGQSPTPGRGTAPTAPGQPGAHALEEARRKLGTLTAGTYYIYGGPQRYQQRNVLWNVRVDVREGADNSVKLDQANVTTVN